MSSEFIFDLYRLRYCVLALTRDRNYVLCNKLIFSRRHEKLNTHARARPLLNAAVHLKKNVSSWFFNVLQTTGSNIGDALVQANAKGFPSELLYNVAGMEGATGRSGNDKERLAKALESSKVQQAAKKAAVEYAVKDLATSREDTEGYCSYSWLSWLPFMNCDEPVTSESRQPIQLINNKRNCVR